MNEFDIKAAGWDLNPMHLERSAAVAELIRERIPLNRSMRAMEFGAGTGITSFLLKNDLGEITMIDSSAEMVRIMTEKTKGYDSKNLKPVFFDLEKNDWEGGKFDLIVTQMVLHHVDDIEGIIIKFHKMLSPHGRLAVADLYPEDGSFHGMDFSGHKGFDPEELSDLLKKNGYINISHEKCYVVARKVSDTLVKQFDIFLLFAERN
jgi:2-polyprenyl-3-methyl-5-hydroxy-6-metoxy-1,4-benzoquinol methylase